MAATTSLVTLSVNSLFSRSLSTLVSQNVICSRPEVLTDAREGLILKENFISPEEEETLMKEVSKSFRGTKYEYSHWDGVITGFHETEKSRWTSSCSQSIIHRLNSCHFDDSLNQSHLSSSPSPSPSPSPPSPSSSPSPSLTLPLVHVLDLAEDGYISPHIDSIKFCGNSIAGISLLSNSVMKLIHRDNTEYWIDVLLPCYSLYIMRGNIRYNYTHQILSNEHSYFNDQHIQRHRRVSIISRTTP